MRSHIQVALCCLTVVSGSVVIEASQGSRQAAVVVRGAPANQPHGYQPQINQCPSDQPTARSAAGLSSQEVSWLATRREATIEPMSNLLSRINISGFDAAKYISDHSSNASALPNIGIAVSGGGYRAMTNGAGVIAAFDNRTANSTGAGHLGGLLQSATYLSALSGGGWLVGSLYSNNFTSVQSITNQPASDSNDLWRLSNSIFEGPDSNFLQSLGYYGELIDQVHSKKDAGFNTTITDYWGRALSYQLINATDGGPAYTFSSIASQDWFTSGSAPLPILVSDGRAPGEAVISSNSTVYEFNPWELGSFDPTTYAFTPLKYLGTNYSSGTPSTDECVTGFDSASFIMGTSSSLFNAAFTEVNGTNTTGLVNTALQLAISGLLQTIGEANGDIASYPNPFYRYNSQTNPTAASIQLTLVDGGEDGQNIPLVPLIQPVRQVDVIFAVDSSADTTEQIPVNNTAANWPDGASLISAYERSLTPISNGTAFPAVPDRNSFFNLGLNNRPTFFGCDSSNTTGSTPLIVYLPNAPYSYTSNTSTFDLDYPSWQRDAIINNAYNLATQGNGTLDSSWTSCVGCAILSRSFTRTGTTVPEACTQCFHKYCWNGTIASHTPSAYQPTLKLSTAAAAQVTAGQTGAAMRSRSISVTVLSIGLASLFAVTM